MFTHRAHECVFSKRTHVPCVFTYVRTYVHGTLVATHSCKYTCKRINVSLFPVFLSTLMSRCKKYYFAWSIAGKVAFTVLRSTWTGWCAFLVVRRNSGSIAISTISQRLKLCGRGRHESSLYRVSLQSLGNSAIKTSLPANCEFHGSTVKKR